MKTSVDRKNKRMYRWSFFDKVRLSFMAANLLLSICLAIYSIAGKWGNSTLGIIWLVMLGVYIIFFAVTLYISSDKGAKILRHRLKKSIVTIKLINSFSTLLNLIMALLVLIVSRLNGDMSGAGAIIGLLAVLLFTLIGLILNVNSYKRIKKRSQKQKENAKQKENEQTERE